MASSLRKSANHPNKFDASPYALGIAVSEWHEDITRLLLDGCRQTLIEHGVDEKNIQIAWAPGAFELPLTAQWLMQRYKPHATICLGCVIKGETQHHEYINQAVSQSLMQLGTQHNAPFIYGLLTTDNLQQAQDRAGGKYGNKGVEAALAALRMVHLFESRLKP